MSRYRRAPVPGATYFFTLNTYRRQAPLIHTEVLAALRSAHRVMRATRPFRIEAMVVLPDHLHTVWTLPPEDAESRDDADYARHIDYKHYNQAWARRRGL
jgi:putative transposase